MENEPVAPAVTGAPDPLTDAAKRRQLEAELSRLGMTPDEVRRLLEADANSTDPKPRPEPTLALPAETLARRPLAPTAPSAPTPAAKSEKVTLESLQSYAAQLAANRSAERVQEIEAVDLSLPEFREASGQEMRQAEALLREAHLLRKKERFQEAIVKCREALQLVPKDAAALEMFGDLLQGIGRIPEALAAYQRAKEADSRRASAERKYADLLMRQQNWSGGSDPEAVPKNPWVSDFLSLLFPGAGQIYNGQLVKGVVIILATLACVYGYTLFRGSEAPPPSVASTATSARSSSKQKADWGAMTPIVLGGAVYLYALFDAHVVAKRLQKSGE